MPEIGPEHPLTYRQEIVGPLFQHIRDYESSALVGSASMGKSRLVKFILRDDVQRHYLGEERASGTLLVLADCNRLTGEEVSELDFYELLLTALTEASGALDRTGSFVKFLNQLRREAITSANGRLAKRNTEAALNIMCQNKDVSLCVILDEFDACYRSLPASTLANLRALRDMDKYRLSYVVIFRDHPGRVRPPADCEGFYELISRSVLGLKPYTPADARRVIEQLQARRSFELTDGAEAKLVELSGGHPGLLVALADAAHGGVPAAADDWESWAFNLPQVQEECRKLFGGLGHDEQLALSHIAQGVGAAFTPRSLLELKGLIWLTEGGEYRLFSSFLRQYVLSHGLPGNRSFWLDKQTSAVWVEGKRIANLTPLEYDLLLCLYRRMDQACTREEIINELYPLDAPDTRIMDNDNRVDVLVRRLRQTIEPRPGPSALPAHGAGQRVSPGRQPGSARVSDLVTPIHRICMLSVHTCPLAVLGGKETGGMNVYVRDLARAFWPRGWRWTSSPARRTRTCPASATRWGRAAASFICPPGRSSPTTRT